jgi:hypothetical protein
MAGSAQVIKNLYSWATMKKAGCAGESLTTAKNMTDYARKTARWQDRTGNAREGLNGGMFWETPEILKLFIAHSMEYGVFLELAHDRKYQILEESLNKFKDSWFNAIKKIIES